MNKLQKLAAAGLTDSPEDVAKFYDRFPTQEDFDMWYESQNQYAMGGITDGIAFPQQPDASDRRVPYYDKGGFFAPNVMPWNGPVGFYANGGFTDEIAFPQQPTAHINFSAFPWQPQYAPGGNTGSGQDSYGKMTPAEWDKYNLGKGYTKVPTKYNIGYADYYNPKEYGQGEGGWFRKIEDLNKPSVNYANDPTYKPYISYQAPQQAYVAPKPKKQITAPDLTKQGYAQINELQYSQQQGNPAFKDIEYESLPSGTPGVMSRYQRIIEGSPSWQKMHPGSTAGVASPGSVTSRRMGGGLPGGANEGMPCMECGGYMEMGGDNMFGGQADGTMSNFKEGGQWIQKATASIKRRGTEGVCTGDKFGGPSCPPGSKRYNLAKTFRKMAKKQDGGSIFDARQDYLKDRNSEFRNRIKFMNDTNAMAEAANDRLSMQQDAMANYMPMAQAGMTIDSAQPLNYQNLYNQRMYGQQMANLDRQNKNLFDKTGYLVNQAAQQPEQYVKHSWTKDMSYPQPDNNVPNSANYTKAARFGGMRQDGLPKAQEGTSTRVVNPSVNPFTSANAIPSGIQGPVSYSSDAPYPGESDRDYAYRSYLTQAGRQMYGDRGYPQNVSAGTVCTAFGCFPQRTSGNNQTRYDYDYGTPEAYDNLRNRGGRYTWNTPGWGGVNPFSKEMFENQYFTTRLAAIDPEFDTVRTGFLGLGKKKDRLKKLSIKYNTYLNPQTGRIETKPAQGEGTKQGEGSKEPDYKKLEGKFQDLDRNNLPDYLQTNAFESPTVTPKPEGFMDYMNQQPSRYATGPRDTQIYGQEPVISDRQKQIESLINNRFVDPRLAAAQSSMNYKTPVVQSGPNEGQGFWDYMMAQQMAGPREYSHGGLIRADYGMQPPGSQFYNMNMNNAYGQQDPYAAYNPENPYGSYTHTQELKTDPWSQASKVGTGVRAGLAFGTMIGNIAEKNRIDKEMQQSTLADNTFSAVTPQGNKRGNIGESGQMRGMQMGAPYGYTPVEQTGAGFMSKYGGSPNYEVGDVVELTDEEIENIRKAGGEIEYI